MFERIIIPARGHFNLIVVKNNIRSPDALVLIINNVNSFLNVVRLFCIHKVNIYRYIIRFNKLNLNRMRSRRGDYRSTFVLANSWSSGFDYAYNVIS